MSSNKNLGQKDRKGKIMVELVLPEFIEGVAKVLTLGAKKYAPNTWQNVKNPIDTHYASLFRHLLAYRRGEMIDQESKLPHLYHIATNCMFLIDHEIEGRR